MHQSNQINPSTDDELAQVEEEAQDAGYVPSVVPLALIPGGGGFSSCPSSALSLLSHLSSVPEAGGLTPLTLNQTARERARAQITCQTAS